MFNNRRGQAAMEFLMTYGWAILAAIIAIGVLAYFYFSPGDLGANAAVLNAPFYAQAWQVDTDSVQLGIKNNGQDSVTITNVTITGDGGTECFADTSTALASGSVYDADASCDAALTAGDTFKGDVVVKYTRTGSTIELTSTGSVSSKVVA